MMTLDLLIDETELVQKKDEKNSLFDAIKTNFTQCLNHLSVDVYQRHKEISGQFIASHSNSVSIQIKLTFKQIQNARIIFIGQGICFFKDKQLRLQSKALIDFFSRYCTHYMSSLKLGKLSCYESGLIYFRIDVDQVSICINHNMANFLFTIIKTIKGTMEGQISRILYFYQQFTIMDAIVLKQYFRKLSENYPSIPEPKAFQEKQIQFLQIQVQGLHTLQQNEFKESQNCINNAKIRSETQGKSQKQHMISEIKIKSEFNVSDKNLVSQGGFGHIYRENIEYINESNTKKKDFIVKTEISNQNHQKILNEINIMRYLDKKSMNHKGREYIIQYYVDTKKDGYLFLDPMQHYGMDNFTLKYHEVISIYTKIHLLYQLSIALHFLHSNNCVHLDLKPGNILISRSWQIRLIDFGEAKILEQNKKTDVTCRTLPYAAPEFFIKTQPITTAYDIFSFGVIMHQMLFNEYPFQYHESKEQSFIEILKSEDNLHRHLIIQDLHLKKYGHKDIIQPLAELIKKCLRFDPQQRPTINVIVQVLGYCFDYLRGFYF